MKAETLSQWLLGETDERNNYRKTSHIPRLVLKIPEGLLDVFVDFIEVLPHLGLPILKRVLELHGRQFMHNGAHGVSDDLPRYLLSFKIICFSTMLIFNHYVKVSCW